MVMNISCKFKKASYNIFFVTAVIVKSLYTLRWQCNEAKYIVSSGYDKGHTITLRTYALLSNSPNKCEIPAPYSFSSKLLRQGQRSNQCHPMTLHIYTPMSLPNINFLHLTVSEI